MGKELDFDKLKGSENFHNWKFAMSSFLALKGYDKCIIHRPPVAATSTVAAVVYAPEIATETDDAKLSAAKATLALGVQSQIYIHIQNCTTALDIWNTLHKLYEDRGLARKITLLKNLLSNKLSDCDGMQDYVDKIVSASNKLAGVGFPVNDEWLGSILLAGLTDEFKPFIMGLEANGAAITGDLIMAKLLDCRTGNDNNGAFLAKKPSKKWKKKQRKCFNCGSTQHLANACDKPKVEKKNEKDEKSAKAAFMICLENGSVSDENEDSEKEPLVGFHSANCKEEWYIDSGSSRHMTPHADLLEGKSGNTEKITAANGVKMSITGTGDGRVTFGNGNVKVKSIMHVPELAVNLLSVSQIVQNGNTVIFNSDGCTIYNAKNERLLFSRPKGGVYRVEADNMKCFLAMNAASAYDWHRRLGHASYQVMKKMRAGAVDGVNFADGDGQIYNCEICAKGKQIKKPFSASQSESTEILQLIHSDVMGPQKTRSLGHALYLLTFIDDYSRKVFVYFLKNKSDVFETFVSFRNYIEKQTGEKIKILRSDNGGEYVSKEFEGYLNKHGIKHEMTIPHTPEQNGVAERMNIAHRKSKVFFI